MSGIGIHVVGCCQDFIRRTWDWGKRERARRLFPTGKNPKSHLSFSLVIFLVQTRLAAVEDLSLSLSLCAPRYSLSLDSSEIWFLVPGFFYQFVFGSFDLEKFYSCGFLHVVSVHLVLFYFIKEVGNKFEFSHWVLHFLCFLSGLLALILFKKKKKKTKLQKIFSLVTGFFLIGVLVWILDSGNYNFVLSVFFFPSLSSLPVEIIHFWVLTFFWISGLCSFDLEMFDLLNVFPVFYFSFR